jgi:hypothetical protein
MLSLPACGGTCALSFSYRDLAELARELGVGVAPSTVLRWVVYATSQCSRNAGKPTLSWGWSYEFPVEVEGSHHYTLEPFSKVDNLYRWPITCRRVADLSAQFCRASFSVKFFLVGN